MKKTSISNLLSNLIINQDDFLRYLKAKYPLFHNSNFFLRDLQFGIKSYYEKKGILLSYSDSEKIANLFSEKLTDKGIFTKVTDNCWKLSNLDFITRVPGDPFKEIHLGGN